MWLGIRKRWGLLMRDPLWMEGDDVALGKDEENTEPAYTYDTLEEMYGDD
jgi:hypothetical protein